MTSLKQFAETAAYIARRERQRIYRIFGWYLIDGETYRDLIREPVTLIVCYNAAQRQDIHRQVKDHRTTKTISVTSGPETLMCVVPQRVIIMPGVDIDAVLYNDCTIRQFLTNRQRVYGPDAEFIQL